MGVHKNSLFYFRTHEAARYYIHTDINELMKLVDEGYVIMVHGGAKVYIEGSSELGKLKIRFQGVTMPVWILRKA